MRYTIKLNIEIKDAKGATSSCQFYAVGDRVYQGGNWLLTLPNTVFGGVQGDWFGEMVEYHQLLVQLLQPLINGVIVGMSYSIGVDLPTGLNISPNDNADVEEKMLVLGANPPTWRTSIPTYKSEITLNDPELQAFNSWLLQPAWVADYGGITDARGDQIIDISYRRVFVRRPRRK